MAPLLTPVSVPGSPPLFRYHPLHAVVVRPSRVSVATAGPAVAQRGGRALHGTVVADSLGEGTDIEKRRSSFERGAGASYPGLRHAVYVWMCGMQLSVSGKQQRNRKKTQTHRLSSSALIPTAAASSLQKILFLLFLCVVLQHTGVGPDQCNNGILIHSGNPTCYFTAN